MDKWERCKRMREAKARKRMETPYELGVVEIGRATFEGAAFNGKHVVRLIVPMGRPCVDVEVNGVVTGAKTMRGVKALLMRRVAKAVGETFG